MVGSIMNKVIIDDAGNEILIKMPLEESEELKALHAEYLERKAIIQAKEAEKSAQRKEILDRLGLTADEVAALLG